MAAEDARYRQSSQYRLWSFSPAQLSAAREKTNALARANITDRLLSSTPSAPASGANTPDPLSLQQPQPANAAVPDFLTPAEELQMLTYCTSELIRAGIYYKFRAEIQATAAVFLRRFYVTNSIMTYPPREMLKTCLFFGSKAEGQYSSVEK
jgi:cyclin H